MSTNNSLDDLVAEYEAAVQPVRDFVSLVRSLSDPAQEWVTLADAEQVRLTALVAVACANLVPVLSHPAFPLRYRMAGRVAGGCIVPWRGGELQVPLPLLERRTPATWSIQQADVDILQDAFTPGPL